MSTGDDLETVGDPVLELPEQDLLLSDQVVPEPVGEARGRDVRYREHEADVVGIEIVELVGAEDQLARLAAVADEVHFIGVDGGDARDRRAEKRVELRDVPFALANIGEAAADQVRRRVEVAAEGVARRNHLELVVEQQQGRLGRDDESHCKTAGCFWRN